MNDSSDDREAFDKVGSLHRLLQKFVDAGDEIDLVTAFAEAIFAWDGIELCGYVQDTDDQWELRVSAPGAPRGRVRVGGAVGAWGPVLRPMTSDEAERFGFDGSRKALAAGLTSATESHWFLIFAEGFGPLRETSVRLYVDVLRQMVSRVGAIAETRTAWSVLQHLLGATDAREAANGALQALIAVFPAATAAIAVTAPTGAVLLTAGEDEPAGSVRPFGRVSRLAGMATTESGHRVDLTLRRGPGEHFNRREQHLLDRLADVFGAWIERVAGRGIGGLGERTDGVDFAQLIDRTAAQALSDGADVSVLVVAAPKIASQTFAIGAWVALMRRRLRGCDLAGALSDREIGLMLSGTGPDNVHHVFDRLCRGLEGGGTGSPFALVGVASCAAGQPELATSLVERARQNMDRRLRANAEGR